MSTAESNFTSDNVGKAIAANNLDPVILATLNIAMR